MAPIRAKVNVATDKRYVGRAHSVVVEDLNPVLRGWGQYFRWGNSTRKFYAIDRYVNERLAILASRKQGRLGRNWARFSYAWAQSLGVYQLTGRVRYYRVAHARR
jgi:RNA-directed DNA polymerase